MKYALDIREATKIFGERRVLNNICLMQHEGEVLGLLGPNGAGKSTLVRTIAGRIHLNSGAALVFGKTAGTSDAQQIVGYVPQEIALYPLLSASENLLAFGRYQGLRGKALRSAAARALNWAGLADRKNDPAQRLSGGMKRRLNLALGTLHNPELFLLDEPTVGVDPQSRERIYLMIDELRAQGVSILYTTHYMEEAERLCDRIAIIDHGKIIALGTKEQLVYETIGNRQLLTLDMTTPISGQVSDTLAAHDILVNGTKVRARVEDAAQEIREILQLFHGQGLAVRNLSLTPPTLESVFLHLTGKELRE